MDYFSRFCEIRKKISTIFLSKFGDGKEWRKFVIDLLKNVSLLYGFAEMWLNSSKRSNEVCEAGEAEEISKICIDLLNDTAFLKAALDEGALKPRAYFEVLEKLSETGFSPLRNDVRKEIAEILSTNEKVRKYLDDGDDSYSYGHHTMDVEFLSLIKSLDPEYDVTDVLKCIAAKMIRETSVKDERDLFEVTSGAWNFIDGYSKYLFPDGAFNEEKIDEIFSFFYRNFFREKVLGSECFKKLPEFFQKIIIFMKVGDYKNGKLLPEFGIDADELKDDLKKGIDQFLHELNKIARNGGKPSDYYAGEPLFPQYWLSDPKSYLVAQIFNRSISFLKRYYGCWKALKPMLVIFRSLKSPAYHMGLQRQEIYLYPWAFVPVSITQLLGSMEESETEKVCEEWFGYIGKQLHSADDFEVKKRTENPEKVPEKFKSGYDIKVIEPHPVWREAYCEAAGDLRVNLGFEKCRILKHLQKEDIDENVRKAAGKTLERVEKIKEKFDSGSRKRALLNAWWWYRVAHLRSLGVDFFDWTKAQDRKRKEVTFYYPKDFF